MEGVLSAAVIQAGIESWGGEGASRWAEERKGHTDADDLCDRKMSAIARLKGTKVGDTIQVTTGRHRGERKVVAALNNPHGEVFDGRCWWRWWEYELV